MKLTDRRSSSRDDEPINSSKAPGSTMRAPVASTIVQSATGTSSVTRARTVSAGESEDASSAGAPYSTVVYDSPSPKACAGRWVRSVSYTHLTLPTIYSV